MVTLGYDDVHEQRVAADSTVPFTNELVLRDFFTSCTAVKPTIGTSEQTLEDSEAKIAIVNASSSVTLAVDHSKLDSHASVRGFDFNRVDRLVTSCWICSVPSNMSWI